MQQNLRRRMRMRLSVVAVQYERTLALKRSSLINKKFPRTFCAVCRTKQLTARELLAGTNPYPRCACACALRVGGLTFVPFSVYMYLDNSLDSDGSSSRRPSNVPKASVSENINSWSAVSEAAVAYNNCTCDNPFQCICNV